MDDAYENPLISRYASREMATLWGGQRKFRTWRQLWVWLAESQAELGLPISAEQIAQMRAHLDDIDFNAAEKYERQFRHDVMAHIHAFGDCCPLARSIIHLGATSCYVTDNTDLMLIRDALGIVRDALLGVIGELARFARENKSVACLGFTHFQPAQPTTVGKRACLWIFDLIQDVEEVQHRLASLRARGVKGTTGTQDSFLRLFAGDHSKVLQLDQRIADKMGFQHSYPVTGQTYSRKVDSQVLSTLSGIAQSCHKAATDLRLLQHLRELEEPAESSQIGSSAMAYKRNPMRSERICGLARFVISLESSAANTASVQWLERTLDDSANRRLVLPQAFLGVDAILSLYQNVASRLGVNEQVIRGRLAEELPFMATERILMEGVENGRDRQTLHERIRVHSLAAAEALKKSGGRNDLIQRMRSDEAFRGIDLEAIVQGGEFVGRAPQQVEEFLRDVVDPWIKKIPGRKSAGEIRV